MGSTTNADSPDGFLTATPRGNIIEVTGSRLIDPQANHWPLPERAERIRYHTEQAALAEKQQHHFAAAFHLGRLLLDNPGNGELTRRRAEMLKKHAERKG